LRIKKIEPNDRNITYMGIKENAEKSYVFLKGVSKVSGDIQWYVSTKNYDISDAEKIFEEENFKEVFNLGVRKSNVRGWA
tara:strand:+ start:1349 stop:1588 length:240 start_codon:yes stop_codon:yes gene_type:complete